MLYNKNWEYSRPQQIASLAADLIEQRGHAKYVAENEFGSLCIVGAINMAAHGNSRKWSDFTVLIANAIGMTGIDPVTALANWNNAPERTADEVINALRSVCK